MRGKSRKRMIVKKKDRKREEARGAQKAPPDDSPAPQDAGNIDGKTGAVPCPLAVVALDFATKVAEDEGARSDDEKSEEAKSVSQAATEDGPRDEVQKGQDDNLLVVGGPSAGGQADNLQERGELHRRVERGPAGHEAHRLDQEQRQRSDRREVTERWAPLPGFGDGDGASEPDYQEDVGPRAERRRADDGQDPERRQGVGHDAMDEAEPHSAAPEARCAVGAGVASSKAR